MANAYPWLLLKENGVYCQYCSYTRHEVKSRAGVFATKPYTGNRPDKLGRHEASKTHNENQTAYQEQQTQSATHSTVLDLINDSSILTVDENAFCDALRCIYFLCKNEIAYTTNFSGLKALCIQLGNETLPLLRKSGNTNYESEQIMEEMVEAIGWTLEEQM